MATGTPEYVKAAIEGLKFRTSQTQKDEETKKDKHVPLLRAMTEDDVLSHARSGSVVTIVSKDGMKHRVDLSKRNGEDDGKSDAKGKGKKE